MKNLQFEKVFCLFLTMPSISNDNPNSSSLLTLNSKSFQTLSGVLRSQAFSVPDLY